MSLPTLALTLMMLLAAAPAAASAQSFTVNTDQDVTVAGGCVSEPQCSLRDAITAAAGSADESNVISVRAGHYVLDLGELVVSDSNLTIRGGGARSTSIDAAGASRVFSIAGSGNVLEALTITGGVAGMTAPSFAGDGGGVLLSGTTNLAINQVAVNGNSATLNGAGISAPPESGLPTALTVNGSTISGNRVTGGLGEGLGGGIYTLGDVTLTNSTVTGNSVENPGLDAGGGVLAGLDPADMEGTTLVIANSTIAGNSVLAGGMGGGISVDNPTAGVATKFDVRNTIIAGNSAGGTAANCFGIVTISSTNNISEDASCMFGDAGSKTNTDPKLGPLQNNGGETDTQKPAAGSPAIEGGTNEQCPPTDQRGVARPLGPRCDVGAVEQSLESVAPKADLVLSLKAKPKRPKPGRKASFVLTLTNRGPDAASGVSITGSVPKAARKGKSKGEVLACKLAKPKKAKKGKKSVRARGLGCEVGSLPSGATRSLTLIVKKAPARGKLKASAQVRSTSADPESGNDKAKAVATVKKKKKKS